MSLKIALLASGRGTNAQAIMSAIRQGTLDAKVECLISNVEGAPVLTLAQQAGIQSYLIPHRHLSRELHEERLIMCLKQYNIDYLVLAGYMRLMTPHFLQAFKAEDHYRIVNIHPSLLPAFPGPHSYEDAYDYGVKLSGATVHFVDEEIDHGPIILQETFARLDNDTLETFKARGLALEHQLYPKALQLIAENKIRFRYNPSFKRYYIEVDPHVPC
jgi:phosphoribosylglycinamide formyltransferase 1